MLKLQYRYHLGSYNSQAAIAASIDYLHAGVCLERR